MFHFARWLLKWNKTLSLKSVFETADQTKPDQEGQDSQLAVQSATDRSETRLRRERHRLGTVREDSINLDTTSPW